MIIKGERFIQANPERVWAVLLDPIVLKACINGCEQLERIDETLFAATVVTKIGPVKAKFSGKVELADLQKPVSCRLTGQGQGGIAGFAKGGAVITLADNEDGCLVGYDAVVEIGGRIASLGDRLFRGVVEGNIKLFFDRLVAECSVTSVVAQYTS